MRETFVQGWAVLKVYQMNFMTLNRHCRQSCTVKQFSESSLPHQSKLSVI